VFDGRVFDRGRIRRDGRTFLRYGVREVLSGGRNSRSPAESRTITNEDCASPASERLSTQFGTIVIGLV